MMSATKLAGKSAILLVIGVTAALGTAAGCSSDGGSDDSTHAGSASGGNGSAGDANGGKGDTGDSAGAVEPGGDAGAGGSTTEPGDTADAGAAGAAGAAPAGEPPYTLHLSPDATPVTLAITPGGHDRFYGVTFDAAGNIFAVGVTSDGVATTADFSTVVAKFSPEGVLDTTFGVGGYAIRNVAVGTNGEFARGIVVQATGKIVISETVEHAGATDARDRDVALLRFNANGSKDATFGVDGILIENLSDGVVIPPATVGGKDSYLADSNWGLSAYPDDRLVFSGGLVSSRLTDTDFVLMRLSADGVPDETFGTHGIFTLDTLIGGVNNNASPRNVTILPGMQGVIGAGYQPVPGADTKPCVYRVTDTGKLDKTFGVDGVFSESVFTEQTETYAAVPQSTGKLVTAGYARELATETTDILSLRLNADGTRDLSYGTNGSVKVDIGGFADNARRILTLPNDHIVIVGGGRPVTDNVDGVVLALTPDGKPETTFSATGWKTYDLGGPADFIWSLALSPNKTRVAVVGIKGGGAAVGAADDDAALMVLKLVP
jgi:uncharacterized delta-60 repeat protein